MKVIYQIKGVTDAGEVSWRTCNKHEYREAGEWNETRRIVKTSRKKSKSKA